jgi:beta-xylosidase
MPRKISMETARIRYRTQASEVEALRQKSITGAYPNSQYTDYVTCQGTHPGRLSGAGHKKCGKRVSMQFAFKCLYCSYWFCATCAEIHFGKTRKQHNEEMAANPI